MGFDEIIVIVAAVLMLIGLLGCILPGLPGTPISYVGLVMLYFTSYADLTWFSVVVLIMWLLITIVVTIIDTLLPGWMTRRTGGTKKAMWGANLGVFFGIILGLFGYPLFIMVLPFLCALVWEWISCKEFKPAVKSAVGAILGTFVGTMIKLFFSILMTLHFILEIFAW